ncbi:M36 family metallopeptidase [Paenibacillus sp. FSL H7-0714]|uniref:M36 family metallopeptidase n=1 Tax=Paenibacillus sp. FSL H7-0714 TaxID=2954735 RepID=UPI0030FB8971
MIKQIDKRIYHFTNEPHLNRPDESFSDPELKKDTSKSTINPLTGNVKFVMLNLEASNTDESFITRAIEAVNHNSSVLGFSRDSVTEGMEFVPDPRVIKTSANTSVVHLHQVYRGVPVYQMSRTCRFKENGTLEDIVGDNVSLNEEINLIPETDVDSAIVAANEYIIANQTSTEGQVDGWGQPLPNVKINTAGYSPKVLTTFPSPAQYTVLDKGVFEENITAHLTIFPQYPKSRLAWHFAITLQDTMEQYEFIVAADQKQSSEVLLCQRKSFHMKAEGSVYEFNGGEQRRLFPFPRPITEYPVKPSSALPNTFPVDWVEETKTIGNSTQTLMCDSNVSTAECTPAVPMEGKLDHEKVTFIPSDDSGDDQKILNAFYFCNYMHDFFYILGFDEKSGNFQDENFTELGLEKDHVKVNVFSGPVFGTANMRTPADGRNPIMNLGVVSSTNRHTALDADVIFHEYTHGVTNRLVGGPLDQNSLDMAQSSGMGEGWSDYFALTIQNFSRTQEKVVTGAWVVNNNRGIREFKYDDDFPDHFGDLGTGRYTEDDEHNIGEIWCATLMYLNRRLVEKFGKDKGYNLTWRTVIDSLKISRANPSLIDARDNMLNAIRDLRLINQLSEDDFITANQCAWKAFCKFGMGPNARSNGATLNGIAADFELPQNI